MVTLNPRTGELFDDGELLSDDSVLMSISDYFYLMEDTESQFTLHSFRKMFTLYRALASLNGWAENFTSQAKAVKPRFRLVEAQAQAQAQTNAYEYLDLRKDRLACKSELTKGSADFRLIEPGIAPGTVSIAPPNMMSYTIDIQYIDKPSFEISECIGLSGVTNGVLYGLSMDRLPSLMHLPIKMHNATDTLVHQFSNETRTGIDHKKEVKHVQDAGSAQISLYDVIMAVLMSINLEDEAFYQEELQHLQSAMEYLPLDLPEEP